MGRGSSPRLRGAPRLPDETNPETGLIPASAGSTTDQVGQLGRVSAHPRVCGEHIGKAWGTIKGFGSSPRLRGAPGGQLDGRIGFRLIPASAGSTPSVLVGQPFSAAHPRVCGEHMTASTKSRLLPAHPRVCGEHARQPDTPGSHTGSSPRLRGALRNSRTRSMLTGLIPASAGSTMCSDSLPLLCPAHPRVCGEHGDSHGVSLSVSGSSPRLRGARCDLGCARRRCGLIPASAGSTTPDATAPSSARAHPRVCGEHAPRAGVSGCVWGSSPRLRGAPRRT